MWVQIYPPQQISVIDELCTHHCSPEGMGPKTRIMTMEVVRGLPHVQVKSALLQGGLCLLLKHPSLADQYTGLLLFLSCNWIYTSSLRVSVECSQQQSPCVEIVINIYFSFSLS